MHIERRIEIQASPDAVWTVISDIEQAAGRISGIKQIEVLEPAAGPSLVGLKWRETREWMGKDAVEVMWITDAREPVYYETRAESHGCIYRSRLELEPTATGTRLTMRFGGESVTFGSKVLWALTGWMAKKAVRTALDQDLADIKAAVEKGS